MRLIRKDAAVLFGCLILLIVLVAPLVTQADEWNWSTRFMVNQVSEVPGLILQPNVKYVMRLYDSPAERRVVQVFNDDQSKMLTQFMAAADERMEPKSETVFTFIETQPGYPMPIKEWFYPGRIEGLEFIYSKAQAQEIAEHSIEPVQTADAGTLHDLATLQVEAGPIKAGLSTATTTTASIAKLETPPVFEEKPAAEPAPAVENTPATEQPAQIAQNNDNNESNVEQQPTTTAPEESNTSSTPSELPRTAGELPLISLIGLLCLGGGLSLRVLSSRS